MSTGNKDSNRSVQTVALIFLVTVYILDKLGYFLAPATGEPALFGDEAEESVAKGNLLVQATGTICGMLALITGRPRSMIYEFKKLRLLNIYLIFLLASFLYSASVALTMRRVIFFIIVLIIAIALAQSAQGTFNAAMHTLYRFGLIFVAFVGAALVRSVIQGHSFFASPFTVFDAAHRDAEILAIFLLLHWYFGEDEHWSNSLTSFALWTIVPIVLVLTLSRTSLIALILSTVYLTVASAKGKVMILFQVFMVVGILALSFFVLPSSTVENVVRPQTVETMTGRTIMWDFIIAGGMVNPWIGAGFGAFWNPDNIYAFQNMYGWGVTGAHNGFFDTYLNTGLIGLCFVIAFIVRVWISSGRLEPRQKALARALLIFIIVQNLAQGSFQNPRNFVEITFWFLYIHVLLLSLRGKTQNVNSLGVA